MDVPQQIILQLILIFLNAFFASTEIAVLSLSSAKLRKQSEEGDQTAKRLVKMLDEPSGFLSTIQVGITLAGFLGSAFAADNFSGYLVNWVYNDLGITSIPMKSLDVLAVILITLVLSYLTLIFGELVPKRIAMQKPYEIAKFTSPVVLGISIVMKPIVVFLSFSTNLVLKALRMKTETEEDQVTEEEIKMMIELGGKSGAIEASESDWIKNVFDFNDTTVAEVMTQRSDMETVNVDDTEKEILQKIKSTGCSRMPVYGEDDDLIGVLYTKDYLMADENRKNDVRPYIRSAYFVSENMKASELFKRMQLEKRHMAIVIDEYGSINGLITLEDLIEEIFGNIYDEYDIPEEEEVKEIAEGKWLVQGECPIREFEHITGIKLEKKGHYHTMGGVVLEHLEAIPKEDDVAEIETTNLKIKVTTIENRRISEMIVEKL